MDEDVLVVNLVVDMCVDDSGRMYICDYNYSNPTVCLIHLMLSPKIFACQVSRRVLTLSPLRYIGLKKKKLNVKLELISCRGFRKSVTFFELVEVIFILISKRKCKDRLINLK